jgi:hypothetical protein
MAKMPHVTIELMTDADDEIIEAKFGLAMAEVKVGRLMRK